MLTHRQTSLCLFIYALACALLLTAFGFAAESRPKGILLNLNFDESTQDLVFNKTLYPLHVPLGNLELTAVAGKKSLVFQEGQQLRIPHSSLLDPDGSEWIVSVRCRALADGIVMSQGNDETGYLFFLKNGMANAVIQIGGKMFLLRERPDSLPTKCIGEWITLELQIQPNEAFFYINRNRIASTPLPTPLSGTNLYIRIGNHAAPGNESNGFSGAISSLKILRQ